MRGRSSNWELSGSSKGRAGVASPRRLRLAVIFAVVAALLPAWPGLASDPCDVLADPEHRPTQWEYLCHRGAGGRTPNDPTQKTPHAAFATSPKADIQPNADVVFDGSASFARDGRPLRDWVWDFGDGARAQGGAATAKVIKHTYSAPGQYVALLTVHDSIGWAARASRLVTVGRLGSPTATRESLSIPTRASGGAQLRAKITRPTVPGRFPVLLEYGPYCPYTLTDSDNRMSLVRSGYVLATVVAPGACGSTGPFDMFGRQTQIAGYDAVEWLARQPWSDRAVALTGFSGPAIAALLTAAARPPHLVTAAVMSSYADQYRDLMVPGGIPNSNTYMNQWRTLLQVRGSAGIPLPSPGEPCGSITPPGCSNRPSDTDWVQNTADMATHPTYDAYWQERSIVDQPAPTVPILVFGTHRDLWPRAMFELARWVRPAGGRVVQCVGNHGCADTSGLQSAEFFPAAGDARAWLDYHLKRIGGEVRRRPGILTYALRGGDVAGYGFDAGTWTALDAWPESVPSWKKLYLNGTPSTGAIRSLTEAPASGTLGTTPDLVMSGPAQGASKGNTSAVGTYQGAPEVQQIDDMQNLVYETAVLDRDLRVAGPMTLRLFASLATPDFGWSVQIEDVWPDGSSNWISEGYLLASHRRLDERRTLRNRAGDVVRPYHPHTQSAVEALIPGQIYEFQIEIWGVASIFGKGHRLRLSVGGQNAIWRQNATPGTALVHHNPQAPSTLLLPDLTLSKRRTGLASISDSGE